MRELRLFARRGRTEIRYFLPVSFYLRMTFLPRLMTCQMARGEREREKYVPPTIPSEAAKNANIPITVSSARSKLPLIAMAGRSSKTDRQLTKDEEPLILGQSVIPVPHILPEINLLCCPKARLRGLVRLPYLLCQLFTFSLWTFDAKRWRNT